MIQDKNQCLAYACVTLSQILFPASYIFVSQHNFSMPQIMVFRGIVLIIMCYIQAKRKDINLELAILKKFNGFAIRNMLVVIHSYTIMLCHYSLSISIIHSINCSGTIFVFLWDYYLYGVQINRKQAIGVIIGVIGILVTINAGQIYLIYDEDYQAGSSFEHYKYSSLMGTIFFSVLLVIANLLWAYSASLIKTIKMKDPCQMNFHLAILLIFIGGVNYLLLEVESKPTSVYLNSILYTSLPMAIGQFVFVQSFTLTKNTGVIALFIFLSVIVGYSFSLIRYGETLNPVALIGSMMIISSLVVVICNKTKLN